MDDQADPRRPLPGRVKVHDVEEYIKELEIDLIMARNLLRSLAGSSWESLLVRLGVDVKPNGLVDCIRKFLDKAPPQRKR